MLFEKRSYDQQNRLIEKERYFNYTFTKRWEELWTHKPCDVIKEQWTYNNWGLIDKEYRHETVDRTIIFTYGYTSE